MRWHHDDSDNVCTNSMDYPPEWNNPENEDKFYDSLVQCCNEMFGTPQCPYVDECAPTGTPTPAPTSCEVSKECIRLRYLTL